jgi:hypothetical protein
MTELMQQLQDATVRIDDLVLRRHVQKVFYGMGEIKTEVVGVAQARDMLKPLRKRVHAGGVALIADRGNVDNLSEITVMIAATALQDFITDIVDRTMKVSMKRQPLSDLLAGLQPVPQAAADFQIDFAAVAPKESDRSRTEFDF